MRQNLHRKELQKQQKSPPILGPVSECVWMSLCVRKLKGIMVELLHSVDRAMDRLPPQPLQSLTTVQGSAGLLSHTASTALNSISTQLKSSEPSQNSAHIFSSILWMKLHFSSCYRSEVDLRYKERAKRAC